MAGKSLAALFDEPRPLQPGRARGEDHLPPAGHHRRGRRALDGRLWGTTFYEKLTCPKTERVVRLVDGGEAHCAMNNPSLKHQIEFDWLDDVFKKNGASRS